MAAHAGEHARAARPEAQGGSPGQPRGTHARCTAGRRRYRRAQEPRAALPDVGVPGGRRNPLSRPRRRPALTAVWPADGGGGGGGPKEEAASE